MSLRFEVSWSLSRRVERANIVSRRRVILGNLKQALQVGHESVQDQIARRSRDRAVVPGGQVFIEFQRHRGSKFR
jgi:hypothetical protein